jgi:DNA-binding NtrC family response regulator
MSHADTSDLNELSGDEVRPCVLVVEDHDLLTGVLADILSADYEVICVSGTAEAVALLVQGGIDAVLLDYRLPDGSGQVVADRARLDGVPVIWMTGDASELKASGTMSQPLLSKPFSFSDVLDAVATAVEQRFQRETA